MGLRALVAVKIIAQLAAPGNDAKELFLGHQIALFRRVQILNHAAQFGKIGANA